MPTSPSTDDLTFGRIATSMHFTRPEFVERCLRLAAADGETRSLPEILVDEGYLSIDQVGVIEEERSREEAARRIGPYEIVGRLGEGGMGAVHRVRRVDDGRMLALKTLAPRHAADAAIVARFEREVQIARRLDHPHIVRTVDAGADGDVHYLVLELVEGGNLLERIEASGPMDERAALVMARGVAEALDHAHGLGLVHRDIKPANLLFDASGRVRLADFGLARFEDPDATRLTHTGMILGTPHYIAPEQAAGRAVDIRTDLYSLGATLYLALTGRTPFVGDSGGQILVQHLSQDVVPPDRHRPDLSAGATALVVRMMARDPDRRHASPAELIADIDRVLGGRPPLADRPTTWAAAPGRTRTRWPLLALLAGALVVVGLGLGLSGGGDEPAARPDPAAWVDLLAAVDPARDAVAGRWSIEDGALVVARTEGWSVLEFAHRPPADYDFEIEFTCLGGTADGAGSIDQYVAWGGSWRIWSMWCADYTRIGFLAADDFGGTVPAAERGLPARLPVDRRLRSLVEVRSDRATAWIDGRRILVATGPPGDNAWTHSTRRDPTRPGVGCYQSAVRFHRVAVRPAPE